MSILAERYKKYTVLFFPSESTIDEDVLCTILKNSTDAVFLFDSNSLSDNAYRLVAHSEALLKKSNNKLVIATNTNDNTYLSDTLNTETIVLPSVFKIDELKKMESPCDRYGLNQRKLRETNIDYLKKLNDDQKIDLSMFDKLPQKFSQQELVLLMLLCIKDKIYYSDITALDIRFHEVDNFIYRMQGIVEKIPVSKGEKTRHASEKLVHNSKYYLLSIMRNFNNDEIINTVKYIVSKLSTDKARKRLYIETVLFDTLNQLFGHTRGAGKLILDIYEALEPYLNQDMDYWLQRSKSIYRMYPKSYKRLKTAYQYAKKAASDGDPRVQAKAALTTSLICCLLSNQCKDEKDKYNFEIEAIISAQTAITSVYFKKNRKNLKGELGIGRRESYSNMIVRVCDKHSDPSKGLRIAWAAISIKADLSAID